MRWVIGLLFCLPLTAMAQVCHWPLWEQFKAGYLMDGRIVDASDPRQISTSEGQSYGLFFAFVADDKVAFEAMLSWTEAQLAGGDLTAQLPAWLWGRNDNGEFAVLDENSASDADVWMSFALAEAGHRWQNHRYSTLGYLLARRIIREETHVLSNGTRVLLPGREGFVDEQGDYRLNPSYFTPQLFDALERYFPVQPWSEISDSSKAILLKSASNGLIADWLRYRDGRIVDDKSGEVRGSYDAIRNYLWAGMLADNDPAKPGLLNALEGMVALTAQEQLPPEVVFPATGKGRGHGPFGFSAALLPMLVALGNETLLDSQLSRAEQGFTAAAPGQAYYNSMLSLFGLGWYEKRYHFTEAGLTRQGGERVCE